MDSFGSLKMSVTRRYSCLPKVGVFVLVLYCLIQSSVACPDRCLCYNTNEGPTVRCNHQELSKIPEVPTSTVVLDLRFNYITAVKRGDLTGLQHLTTLLLSNNRITTIDVNALSGLIALKYLYLYNNELKVIHPNLFNGLTNLEQLYLHFNEIKKLEPNTLRNLRRLERLYIYHNKLKTLPKGLFQDLKALKRLRLESNQLVCNCDLLWLGTLLRRTPNTETAATCHEPAQLNSRPLVRLTPRDLNCSPPRIVKTPASIEVTISDAVVSFKCKAVGDPTPSIEWSKDSNPLPRDGRHIVRSDGTLDILRPTVADEGIYKCRAQNDAGEELAEASLRYQGVEAAPTLTHYPLPSMESIQGNTITLKCRATGRPNPLILWTKEDVQLTTGPRIEVTGSGDLRISSVRSSDQGTYRCHASNKAGSVVATTNVIVTAAPSFVAKPTNTHVLDGNTASLECRAEGFPVPAIAWSKDGGRLPSQDRHIVLPSGALRIIHARPIDEGQYECQAINVLGVSIARTYLTVVPRVPPSITQKPLDQRVAAGQTVKIRCNATGAPNPVISWIKDDVHITEGNRYSTNQQGVLTVRDVSKSDEGRYECAARNSIGVATARMILFVEVSDREFAGDKFVNASIDQAISSVDRALKATITKLFRNSQPRSPSDLLALFRFPSPEAQQIARAAEVFERTIQLVHEHVASLEMVNVTEGKQRSFFDLLSPAYVSMIANLSGCHVHRQKDNCSDLCFHMKYRSADGTCNNLQHPMWGASLTPFKRLLSPIYENGFNAPIGWGNSSARPSARLVSTSLISAPNVTDDDEFTHMLMQWGQFFDHDLDFTVTSLSFSRFSDGTDCTATCENNNPCFPIQIPEGDPRIKKHRCMQFTRSSPVCGTGTTSVFFRTVNHREQMNQITSFIDGSNIYGSSDEESKNLRDLRSRGLLKTSPGIDENGKPLLPFNRDTPIDCLQPRDSPVPCFLAGDFRANEQLGLLSMHTLWMREHNRIAKELAHFNPHWSADKIYQEARKIVGAQLQHITVTEWLPKIVGPKGMELYGHYNGYDPIVDPSIINSFATAAFRFGHSLINPIIFRLNSTFKPIKEGNIPLHKAFFSPYKIVHEGGIDPVLRGLFGRAAKSRDDKHQLLNTELTERLFEMAHKVALDLGAINIQRGRDHALPGYNAWRGLCNLSIAETFEDLKNEISQPKIRKHLKELYKHPSNVDVWVAGLLEDFEPGSRIGKTFTCIIVEQFKRLRAGDRFWYENPTTFSQSQLTQIRQTTLARVLCDNGDNIQEVQHDAFKRATYPSGYVSCTSIPRLDLRLWKQCCDNRCSGTDQTFTFSSNVRGRFKRSANMDDVESTQEQDEEAPPKQSNAFKTHRPRTSSSAQPSDKDHDKESLDIVVAEAFSALEDIEKVNQKKSALEEESNTKENAHQPTTIKSERETISVLSSQVKSLKQSMAEMTETMMALQNTVISLKREVQEMKLKSKKGSSCTAAEGKSYGNGETWKQDKCTTCRCEESQTICTKQKCPVLSCKNPHKDENLCCMRCLD